MHSANTGKLSYAFSAIIGSSQGLKGNALGGWLHPSWVSTQEAGWKEGDPFDPRTQLKRATRLDYGPRNDVTYADVVVDFGNGLYWCLLCWTSISRGDLFSHAMLDHFKNRHSLELTLHHQKQRRCGYYSDAFTGAVRSSAAGGAGDAAASSSGGGAATALAHAGGYGGFGSLTKLLAAAVSIGPFPFRFV